MYLLLLLFDSSMEKQQQFTTSDNNKSGRRMAYLQNFTHETGRVVLQEIFKQLNVAENAKRIAEAKGSNKDMINMIQLVFPLVMDIQMGVIKKYGFPASREGLVHFSQLMREMENEDPEIAKLRQQIRAIYLPPITINTSNDILV